MDITQLGKQLETLKGQIAAKQGELKKLEEDEANALAELKALGVEDIKAGELQIETLRQQAEAIAKECEQQLEECRRILAGETVPGETVEGEEL